MAKNSKTQTAVETAVAAVVEAAKPSAAVNPQTGLPVGSRKAANAKAAQAAAASETQVKAPVAAVEVAPDMNALVNALPEAVRHQLMALVNGKTSTAAPVAPAAPKVVTVKPENDPLRPEYYARLIKREMFASFIGGDWNAQHKFWEHELFIIPAPSVADMSSDFTLCGESGVILGKAANVVDALRLAADLIESNPNWKYAGKPEPKPVETKPEAPVKTAKATRTPQQDKLIADAAAKRKK